MRGLKSDGEIPDFLKINEKGDGLSEYFDDEAFSTTCMYTEMTLKNTKLYAPKFPIVAAPPPPPQPTEIAAAPRTTLQLKTAIPKIVTQEKSTSSSKKVKERLHSPTPAPICSDEGGSGPGAAGIQLQENDSESP